jgi:biopolymer transport protein ExbB
MDLSAGRLRTRWATLLLFGLLAGLFTSLVASVPPAYAQPENNEAKEPAPQPDSSSSSTTSKKESRGGLVDAVDRVGHIIKSLGILMGGVLALVSIALVALVVLLAMDLRMGAAIPPAFVEDFTDTVNKRKFKEAFDLARNDNSFLGNVLTAGMGRLQYGIEDSRETARNMVETIRSNKDQFIVYLATIGTIGPMLGLVGTVWGMIGAFMSMNDNDRTRLAEQLSHSLSATLCGIGLSVPAIFCHSLFRNRLTKISMETSNLADDLLTQMYHNSKRPAAAPQATPAPVATAAVRPAE